tara:strand:+ start:1629 stop:2060 length:432 start_codon:yes stop_codon:yes gene_type:complete
MENWREFMNNEQVKGAPIKNRPALSIYPPPGALFNSDTGEFKPGAVDELLNLLDDNKQQMKSDDDPYVDNWLENVRKMTRDAIASLSDTEVKLSKEEQEKFRKIEIAAAEVRALIAARNDDFNTLDVTDPGVPTLQDFNENNS